MGNYLMVFVLTTATVGISHQVPVNIYDIVNLPSPSIVCVYFFRNRYCSLNTHDCNDRAHCKSLNKVNDGNYPMLRLPDQNVTNENFFKVYIYTILVASSPPDHINTCALSSNSDCQFMNSSSYQVNSTIGETYSYRVNLTDLPVTQPTSVLSSVHTTELSTTASHPSTSTRGSTLDQTTVFVVQTTDSSDQTTINQTFFTSTSPVVSPTSTRGKASPPPNTDTTSGSGALIGGIIGGVFVVIIVIIVIITCCCSKRICRSNAVEPGQAEKDSPDEKSRPGTAVSSGKVIVGIPGTDGQDVIPSLPPEQTSSQFSAAMDAMKKNSKLPLLVSNDDGVKIIKNNKVNKVPHQPNEAVQGSSQETENRKKKKKKKKEKKQKRMDNESVPTEAEQGTAPEYMGTENETEYQMERRERKKDHQMQQENEAVRHEAELGNMRTENETESKKERRERKRREKQVKKEMQKQIKNEHYVEFDVRQEQANLLISEEAFSKEERKRRKKEKKRAKRKSHEPSTEDILTGNENTWSASAPIPNINEWIEGNPGATTPYITNQASIDSYEQHGSQGRVKMRDGKVKRKQHKEPDEGNESHIDFKELNDFM